MDTSVERRIVVVDTNILLQFQRLDELLRKVPERKETLSLPAPTGKVSVEGIRVAPPGVQVPVLKGISFSLEAGELLGIVGPSAAGKSTLARALLGVWPTTAGVVRLDGADIFKWNRDELGPHIGYLPQDIELFDGSISENIARFGEINPDLIVAAAKLAGVHQMVLRLPEGYDTQIGAAGGTLAGGQRQRIGLHEQQGNSRGLAHWLSLLRRGSMSRHTARSSSHALL